MKVAIVGASGAVGQECFDGFVLLNREKAEEILRKGVDDNGRFYSVYTWIALMCFCTGMFV